MAPKPKYAPVKGKAKNPKRKVFSEAQAIDLVMQEAKRRGYTNFSPIAAAGMVGSFMQESGLKEDVINFNVRGDNGSAHGIMQWREGRLDNLKRFAAQQGKSPTDPLVQISFAFEEADPNSKFVDTGSVRGMKGLLSAKNVGQAALAWIHAERPYGYKGNPTQAEDAQSRIKLAETAARSYGAGNVEAYSPSMNSVSGPTFNPDGSISRNEVSETKNNVSDMFGSLGYEPQTTYKAGEVTGTPDGYNFGFNAPMSQGIINRLSQAGFAMPKFGAMVETPAQVNGNTVTPPVYTPVSENDNQPIEYTQPDTKDLIPNFTMPEDINTVNTSTIAPNGFGITPNQTITPGEYELANPAQVNPFSLTFPSIYSMTGQVAAIRNPYDINNYGFGNLTNG